MSRPSHHMSFNVQTHPVHGSHSNKANKVHVVLHSNQYITTSSRSPGYERDYRSSRGSDEYRPSSRGGRDSYEDRERVERGYGRAETERPEGRY